MEFKINSNGMEVKPLFQANSNKEVSTKRISSGKKINGAADDAAGLVISELMNSQSKGYRQALQNTQDGISALQTADGALSQSQDILQRMRELAGQASNGILQDDDRAAIGQEMNELSDELDNLAQNSSFNSQKLLDGSFNATLATGPDAGDTVNVQLGDMSTSGLGINGLNIDTQSDASTALTSIDSAMSTVASQRSQIGALENQMDHIMSNNQVADENITAATSRIQDTDMAYEMMSFTKAQLLQNAGTMMMAQSNLDKQSVLTLLK